tara:strand:+ start:506 stop:622 length:117 start_codon:yes stop_codon:yes gene_type:complete
MDEDIKTVCREITVGEVIRKIRENQMESDISVSEWILI